MTRAEQIRSFIIGRMVSLAGLFLLVTAMVAPAQTFTVLHTFSGPDGTFSEAGLIRDRWLNLPWIHPAISTERYSREPRRFFA